MKKRKANGSAHSHWAYVPTTGDILNAYRASSSEYSIEVHSPLSDVLPLQSSGVRPLHEGDLTGIKIIYGKGRNAEATVVVQ